MKKRWPKLQHGDGVKVVWWDITGDMLGHPDDAKATLCETFGHFHSWRGKGTSRSLVTCLTIYPEIKDKKEACRGSDSYPVGIIQEILKIETKCVQTTPLAPSVESSIRPSSDKNLS